ncbi:unnamed protein product [Rotaria sordida]|uniref:Uncharacterized protein n=1 Tax=Rotaria sordida TaxID=392033 RepID=A0A819A7N2_9BILA|nr:unnamed protein product [Rotaria sordida]CAF3773581.1 unnamed protein product [Rotaria sordida]
MNTMKNPLSHASPLPSLHPIHPSTPLKSSHTTIQPILPNTPSTSTSKKRQTKKHVRFASKLETVEKDLSLSKNDKPIVSTIKSNKRIIDSKRDDEPLYGAYVEYLEKHGALTCDTSEIRRPSRPSPPVLPSHESEIELSTYTKTSFTRNKSSAFVVESITVTTPPTSLPRIVHPTTVTKKKNNTNNNNRQQSLPTIDSNLKQQIHSVTPSNTIQSRKTSGLVNKKNHSNSIHSTTTKQIDLSLPLIKDVKSNEKLIRTDNTKIINEYCQSKKFTEIISSTLLPGTNKQINHISEQSVLPNLSKISQNSYHNHINNEPYFFQNNNNNDQIQPVIH